jgi:hypothetical protein
MITGLKNRKNRDLSGVLGAFGLNSVATENSQPQRVASECKNQVYRFGTNEHLLFDLDAAFRVFDVSNKTANLFFLALVEYSERCEATKKEMVCFCQPSMGAYKSALHLCRILDGDGGESLQAAFNDFIETHTPGAPLGEWMQEKDAPLWHTKIYNGKKIVDSAVCNAVQTAVFCGYWSAKNPDTRFETTEA